MLQHVLASHSGIATGPEPWILLPLLSSMRATGTYADYGQRLLRTSLAQFHQALPRGTEDYLDAIRAFAMTLYGKASRGDAQYFVDKSPPYSLVVEEVIRLFPDGKFIFLWRNPLAIVASTIRTRGGGKWRVFRTNAQLFDGLANLVAAWEKYGDRAWAVRYEDLVSGPEAEISRLTDYLDMPFDAGVLSRFGATRPNGMKHVDPSEYDTINEEPLGKWKRTLTNPLRKAWCRRYLQWIGEQRLATMGYDLDELLHELAACPTNASYLISDAVRMIRGILHTMLEPHIIGAKISKPAAWHRHHMHT
jgi:hypothetical protein